MTKAADAKKTPLWKRLLPTAITVGIVVYLFGWVLPQYIDYEVVFREIGAINAQEWIILVVIASLRLVARGLIYMTAQPGMTTKQGLSLYLVSNSMSMIPPGGMDLITRFQMCRGWGFGVGESTSATIGSYIFNTFGKLLLPVVAILLLDLRRIQDDDLDALAIIGLITVVVGGAVLFLIVRSPNLAERTGKLLGRIVRWVAGIFRREVATDFRDLALKFSEQNADLLRTRWHLGLAAGVGAQVMGFVVLLLAIRSVGIDQNTLDWVVVFTAFSAVAVLTTIPVFKLPGIAEAIYIGALNLVSGGGIADQLVAAVFVFRFLTWLAPIPLGGIAFSRWRKQSEGLEDIDILDSFESTAT